MQKTLVAASLAAVLGMSGAAYAADIYAGGSSKDAPVYVPETSWTGFYLGVGGGGGAVNHDLKATFGKLSGELNGLGGDGGFGTVEVGYDRQFGHFVAGVFFNYDFTDINTSGSISSGSKGLSASYDLDGLWSVGGRFGYLVNPSTLAYVLGAYSQAHFAISPSNPYIGDQTYSGFSVGGGLETRLGGNWFVKAEYRFTALDTQTLFNKKSLNITDDADIHEGRVVLSYKLGPTFEPLK
ncbi:MAG: outer membrane protein [Rhodomicrobium sp.]